MKLTPYEVIIIWKLMLLGDGLRLKEMPSGFTKRTRERLAAAGLIRVEKQGRSMMIYLNDEPAWDWAMKNLDADISVRAQFAGAVLQEMLVRLKAYMDRRDVLLSELLAPNSADVDVGVTEERVKVAYLAVSGGQWSIRVRLFQLKQQLTDTDPEDLNRLLVQMHLDEKAYLMRLDHATQMTEADRESAIVIAGEPHHLIYLKG
jgi:hypothetical protein